MNLTIVNGSPHDNGHTAKALKSYCDYLIKSKGYESFKQFQIPVNFMGCAGCSTCVKGCRFSDKWFSEVIDSLSKSQGILIGTPVYLDMPTAQTVAFLTRLNCMAESTGREFFHNKKAYITTVSYCSGTKAVSHTLMGACEMLGFTIEGRSTREHIVLWKDNKLRGGMSQYDSIFIEDT